MISMFFNPLSTDPRKWSRKLKQFVSNCQRIVSVLLIILWDYLLPLRNHAFQYFKFTNIIMRNIKTIITTLVKQNDYLNSMSVSRTFISVPSESFFPLGPIHRSWPYHYYESCNALFKNWALQASQQNQKYKPCSIRNWFWKEKKLIAKPF